MSVSDWFWKTVFWWKKQTGFVDFGKEVEISGVVTMIDDNTGPGTDGDYCFNVKVDPQYEHMITTPDGRMTSEDGKGPSMHCEIPPWLADKFADQRKILRVGMPVIVRGEYGFDGVHLGVPEWREIIAALVRHPTVWKTGWFEIHPVSHLEVWP